jgi:hypothetical protein
VRLSGVPAGSYRANDFPAFGLTRTAGRDASEAADCSEHRKPVQAPTDLMVRGRTAGRAGHEDPRERRVGVWGPTLPSAQPGVTAPLPVMLVATCEGLPL